MADKGEYRGIYEAVLDDPDFQELPSAARHCFFVLRLKLGRAGIAPFARPLLPIYTGLPAEECELGVEALIAADWIRCERNVIWLRNGIRHDPLQPMANGNQRTGLEKYLGTLPKLAIANECARYYGLRAPFPELDETPADGSPSEGASEGMPIPSELRKTEDGNGLTTNQPAGVGEGEPIDPVEAAFEVIRAANAGMAANPAIDTDAMRPIDAGHGKSQQQVAEWLRDGIPLKTITETVTARARAYRPSSDRNRQISTLTYLDGAVRDEHARQTALADGKQLPDDPAPSTKRSHRRGTRRAPDQQTYVPDTEIPEFCG